MKLDALKQYVKLRTLLTQERERIESRLRQLNEILGATAAAASKAPSVPAGKPRAAVRRIKNPISLRAGVIKLTKEKPLTKPEILAGMAKFGWKTTSKKPQKLLDLLLYGKNPKFKNQGGKFSPA